MKKIGIIGAMEVEVETLKKDMEVGRVVKKVGMEFHEGVLNGMPVVVVRSGICKVNAAVCTQILIDDFGVDGIINTGVGGSLNAEINIGDIVISTDVVHHDVNAVEFGYALGQIPQMKVFSFPADETFAEKAKAACNRVNPDITVWRGRICSGDQFVSSQEQKDQIIKAFHGWCTEMEGAGIAQAAYLNDVPLRTACRSADERPRTVSEETISAGEAHAAGEMCLADGHEENMERRKRHREVCGGAFCGGVEISLLT